jgi:hypothetical protein
MASIDTKKKRQNGGIVKEKKPEIGPDFGNN